MGYFDVLESNLLLVLVIIGLLIILGVCAAIGIKAYRHAIETGISKEVMGDVIKSSAVYSIVPSLAVVVGLVSLSAVLGIYWPWFRLSVIGSLAMELVTSNMAAVSMGYTDLSAVAAANDASAAGLIMLVMSISVLTGLFIQGVFGKSLQSGVMKIRKSKSSFSILITECFMLALMAVYIPDQVYKGTVATATLITSALVTILMMWIMKKFKVKWLGDFVMTFALIIGMASSILWSSIL